MIAQRNGLAILLIVSTFLQGMASGQDFPKRIEKPREKKLLLLFKHQEAADREIRVLGRILREKRNELKNFDQELSSRFRVRPDRQYHLDQVTGQISEVLASGTKQMRHTLASSSEIARFGQLMSARQLTVKEMEVIRELIPEAATRSARIGAALLKQFGVRAGRQYSYRPETRILREVGRSSAP